MKKAIAILSIMPISLVSMTAQHYQTICPKQIAYFSNASGDIRSIHIDTLDWEMWPNRNIQDSGYCRTPYGPSWIGRAALWNADENGFYNRNNEYVKIKISALLNESWKAYEKDNTIIMATVIDIGIIPSYLGLRDWIKEIGFQAYDKNMVPKDSPVNETTIILSENYGLFKTLNFYLFPDIEIGYPPYRLEEYNLVGLSDPKTGIQNLTWFEVFDFRPGDEIHSYDTSNLDCNAFRSQTIDKYLSRWDYEDSIMYEIEREQLIEYFKPETSANYFHDTIRMMIRPNLQFDHLPGEPVFFENSVFAYNMKTDGDFLSKAQDGAELYGLQDDNCWEICCIDRGDFDCKYFKGLGGPYCYYANYFMCWGKSQHSIVYYKKGDKTWGTPLVISAMTEAEQDPVAEIYPNPAREYITVTTPSSGFPFRFELMDLQGRILLQQNGNAESIRIELNRKLKGIYIYRITGKDKNVRYGKILVE